MKKPKTELNHLLYALLFLVCYSCNKDDTSSLPLVATSEVFSISSNAVTIKSTVTNADELPIDNKGICWSNSFAPTIEDNSVIGTLDNTDLFCRIEQLNPNTKYFARTYLMSNDKVIYGTELEFTTNNTTEDIDGNIYNTVTIGSQTWMVENLQTSTFNDGSVIDYVDWSNLTSSYYCWYEDYFAYKNLYGALYNYSAIASNKLCPQGWRIPTIDDWQTLKNYIGEFNGMHLQATDKNWSESLNISPTNYSGFSAQPAGSSGNTSDTFNNMGTNSLWWSKTIDSDDWVWYTWLRNQKLEKNAIKTSAGNINFLSVRCIKEEVK